MLISACAPVLIASTAGASAIYDERSLKTIYQDEGITHQALGQIKNNPSFSKSNINLASLNNRVLLVGQTPTIQLKSLAFKLTKSIKDVEHVYNQIEVAPAVSPLVVSQDAWITAKVKTAMLTDIKIESAPIKVITENKTVYLMGIINEKQASIAADVVSKIKGVNKVVTLFQIKDNMVKKG